MMMSVISLHFVETREQTKLFGLTIFNVDLAVDFFFLCVALQYQFRFNCAMNSFFFFVAKMP